MTARRGGATGAPGATSRSKSKATLQAELDARWMARCLELAAAAPGRIAPNPRVGCVIVSKKGEVLAEGFHRGPGTAHAEVDALNQLGGKARGATLYCNLEPCAHYGRTPPCAPAVAAAGVARVVIGGLDPVPGHGGGAEILRAAGIAVESGVLEEECRRANRAFFTWGQEARPYVVLKAAMTLDGKIATVTGESQWISGETARLLAHRWRSELEAIVVGRGTVEEDDPRLTVRLPDDARSPGGAASGPAAVQQPLRIVLDSQARSSPRSKIFATPGALVACLRTAPAKRLAALRAVGAEPLLLPPDRKGRVSIRALLRALGKRGVTSLLVEGGAELHASFLSAQLVDELRLVVAPLVFGGRASAAGPAWIGGDGVSRLARAPRFAQLSPPQVVGEDVLLTLRPLW